MITKRRLITLSVLILLLIAMMSAFVLPKVFTNVHAKANSTTSCSGVTKTATGGYTFAWLHTANGNIVAPSGCPVNLKGFNWPGTGFDSAIGDGSVTKARADIPWFGRTFHMNVWRIILNAVWWNTDVAVPKAGMNYQAWIQNLVKLMESNGDYVLLTKGPQFHEPPCGGSVKYCPHQNQAAIDLQQNPKNPQYQQQTTTGQYINDAVTMWTSVAHLYANDPAVLYDSWNEMHNITPKLWQQSSNTLINTIQKQNPRALVFLGGPDYQNGLNPLLMGQVPAFTQSNLVYDFHVYSGYNGTYQGQACHMPLNEVYANWPTNARAQVGYAHQHGAASFSEWGGCNDIEPYNTRITQFAAQNHILLAYYSRDAVYNSTTYQLNSNGTAVQTAYAAIS